MTYVDEQEARGAALTDEQPTYKDITTYSEVAAYLRDWLIKESIEAYNIRDCSQDDVIAMLHDIEDDLLYLADKIKVIAQDVIVGAIRKEAQA